MSIAQIATIVFFAVWGTAYFVPFMFSGIILAVAAIVAALATALGK